MFASNQIFEISGSMEQLKDVLELSLKYSGWYDCFTRKVLPTECVYQITEGGLYCIGWEPKDSPSKDGWKLFPKESDSQGFDLDYIVSKVSEWLEKALATNSTESFTSGAFEKGFLLKAIPESHGPLSVEGVKSPFYGIVSIVPYMQFFAK